MIIVVTGMVGIDKKSYLQKVCEIAASNGKEVCLCNVGDMMYAEAPDVPAGKILDISLKRLHSLRRSIFKDIIAKSKTEKNLIVNTHATFRWKHGLFPAVDFDQMRQLNADMYICMIEGVTSLHYRLTEDHVIDHTLKDLIVWREEEIICTQMLCKGINDKTPFYCVARGSETETVDTFYNLVFEKKQKIAYLSFPMTAVAELEDVKKDINKFRESIKQIFTCFDPADLEEAYLPHHAHKALEDGKNYVEAKAMGKDVRLDVIQIQQIEKDIYSQTYSRDFMLVDQADMIISYIPKMADGKAAISSGVERELQHAYEAAKDVYVIWTAKQTPSVFITQTATKVFDSVDSAIKFFKDKDALKKKRNF